MDQLVALIDDGHHSLLQGIYDQTKDAAERALAAVSDILNGCDYPTVPTFVASVIADLDDALARWEAIAYICQNASDYATNTASAGLRTTGRAFSALRC